MLRRRVYLVYIVVNVDAPGIIVPLVFDGQAHAVKQHPIEQLGVRGKVLKAGVGDKLAGDAEVGKLHRLVAVKIARKFHIRHGRCLLLGMKKHDCQIVFFSGCSILSQRKEFRVTAQ